MSTLHAIPPTGAHRDLIIQEMLFGLEERINALLDQVRECAGEPWPDTADLLDQIDAVKARGDALRSLGFGAPPQP